MSTDSSKPRRLKLKRLTGPENLKWAQELANRRLREVDRQEIINVSQKFRKASNAFFADPAV
jgi:hypothetical protein